MGEFTLGIVILVAVVVFILSAVKSVPQGFGWTVE